MQNAGHTSQILVNAIYLRNKTPDQDGVTLQQLLEQKNSTKSIYYSTVNKDMGDEIRYFQIKTKDLLGSEFMAPLKFVQRLEDIAQRFLEHVMVNIE